MKSDNLIIIIIIIIIVVVVVVTTTTTTTTTTIRYIPHNPRAKAIAHLFWNFHDVTVFPWYIKLLFTIIKRPLATARAA